MSPKFQQTFFSTPKVDPPNNLAFPLNYLVTQDMIKESHTIEIAHNISGSKLLILPKEDHSSYVINSTKLAPIILSFVK